MNSKSMVVKMSRVCEKGVMVLLNELHKDNVPHSFVQDVNVAHNVHTTEIANAHKTTAVVL